jgi:nicotinamidase-related amidase
MTPATTALLMIDMQNDFLHPQGAYGRAGVTAAAIAALPARIKPLADSARTCGGWIIATQFTLIPGKNDEPLISPHLKNLRPFLGPGDFAPGSFGQALIDELQPADVSIEKIAYSGFYMSRLEWVLRRIGIETLIFTGIVTNGGVSSTVRDAHIRDFHSIILSDGCAAFSDEAHRTSLQALQGIADIITCAEAQALLTA